MKKFVIQQQIVNFGGTSVIKEPWPHLLVDDFFTPGEFKFLYEESKKMVEDIQPDEKIILQDFWKWKRKRPSDKRTVTEKREKTAKSEKYLNHFTKKYTPICMKYLDQLAPHKMMLFDRFSTKLQATGGDEEKSSHSLHTDPEDKLLTIVVYVYPEHHVGTSIGTRESTSPVEWKQNRALIFTREDYTWHNYPTLGHGPRVTYNVHVYGKRNEV